MARKQFRNKYHVIRHLLRLQKHGADLSPAARQAAKDGVYQAAVRLFGSYRQALVEAGINPLAVYQRRIGKLDDMRLHVNSRLMDAERIGRLIRERRTALGLTQATAAAACGVTESAIANYESGLRVPNAAAVAKLARGLGIPPADLLGSSLPGEHRWLMLSELFDLLSADDQAALVDYAASLAGKQVDGNTET